MEKYSYITQRTWDWRPTKGRLRQWKVHVKQVDLYAKDDADCCPLCIILKYLSLLPKTHTCPAFYLQLRRKFFGKSWFINRPCGVNKLRDMVKDMCHNVGLPGFYSNHSLRSTVCTKLYHNNIDEQIIQKISGHHSLAIRSYKRTLDRQRKLISNCLFSK